MRKSIAGCVLIAAVLTAAPAFAHKLSLFAAQEGSAITGRARYIPGGPADGLPIEVRDGSGNTLTTLTTDTDGRFTYEPEAGAGELVFVLSTADGHIAESRIVPEADGGAAVSVSDDASLEATIEKHLAPLRADLDAWRAEERRRDWIAAGGLIAGIGGAFLLAAARRRSA